VHVAHGVHRVAVVLVGHEGEAELEVDAAARDAACGRGGRRGDARVRSASEREARAWRARVACARARLLP
jgi:hypothetical protein